MEDLREDTKREEKETPKDIVFLDTVSNVIFSWKFLQYAAIASVFIFPKLCSNIIVWWYENFILNILNHL